MIYNVNLGRTGVLDIDKIINADDISHNIGVKPKGCLWASRVDCEYGWEAWCKENNPGWLSIEHAEVEVSNEARILRIDSEEAFDRLLCCGADISFHNLSEDTRYAFAGNINWANVSKHYDVIEFRLDDYYGPRHMLNTIDCDSVVILNKNVITEIRNPATITLRKEAEEIKIDPSAVQIDEYEFAGYDNIKSVVIPEGVTEIKRRAFLGCTSLEDISFPSTLKRIDFQAFEDCDNLKEVILPDNIEYLDEESFNDFFDDDKTAVIFRGHNLTSDEYIDKGINLQDALEMVKQLDAE